MTPDTSVTGPALSIVLVGRNDDYGGSFHKRLSNALNCIAAAAERTGAAAELEVVLVDFGSAPGATLADRALDVSDAARTVTRVILVPPDIVARHRRAPDDIFNGSLAHNIGTRRARGRFVMLTAADTLLPEVSCYLVFSLCRGALPLPDDIDVNRTLFLCPYLYDIPKEFWTRDDFVPTVLRKFFYRTPDLLSKWINMAGAGYGAFLMHRDVIIGCRGLDERYCYWGGSDTEIYLRLARQIPWMATGSLGIAVAHQEHLQTGAERRVNSFSIQDGLPNDEDWGLARETFGERRLAAAALPREPLAARPASPPLRFVDAGSSDLGVWEIGRFVYWHVVNAHVSSYLEIGYRVANAKVADLIAGQYPDAQLHLIIDRERLLQHDSGSHEVSAIVDAEFKRKRQGFLGHSETLFMDSRECAGLLGRISASRTNRFDLVLVNMNEWAHDGLLAGGQLRDVLGEDGCLILHCNDRQRLSGALDDLANDVAGSGEPVRVGPSTVVVTRRGLDLPRLTHGLSKTRILTYAELDRLAAAVAGRTLFIFGAGAYGLLLRRDLAGIGVAVHGFLDNDQSKWGKAVDGVPVHAPDSVDVSASVVVVASTWYQQICEQLVVRGAFSDRDVLVWLRQYSPADLPAANQR